MGKGKKNRKQDDDWENDLDEIAKEAGIDLENKDEDIVPTVKKEKKKKKGKAVDEPEPEAMDDEPVTKTSQKPGFSALMMEDDGDDNDDDDASGIESPEEVVAVKETKSKKKKEKKKKTKPEEDDIADILADLEVKDAPKTGGKKSKKKKKKDEESDYDLENNEKDENKVVENMEEDSGKKSKKKQKKDSLDDDDEGSETELKDDTPKASKPDEEGEDGLGMKTAAQKRAEKKERDKKKKEADKKKKKKKKGDDKEESTDTKTEDAVSESVVEKTTEEPKPSETTVQEDAVVEDAHSSGGEEEGETTAKDKKKKKKKKKKDEEEKTKKTKKPGKAAILKMQEALEEVKREEERLRSEAEAKEKALEEAEDKRLEQLRLEQERKDKKKQKDKERKERLKREGKLLTPAQKEAKRKAEAMLEAMKQQGMVVPNKEVEITEKPKKVQYGKKKKPNKQQQQQQQPVEPELSPVVKEPPKEEVIVEEPKPKEDIADAWDASDHEEEIADSWDAAEEEETIQKKEDKTEKVKVEEKTNTKKLEKQVSRKSQSDAGDDEEEDDDDESEDDDDDESSEESESDSDEEESSEEEMDSDDDDGKLTPEKIKERARERIEKRKTTFEAARSTDNLRAPVICVLGHVDTGKTKILDKIRRTNVQDGEAGGITQQIGATNIPVDKVREQTKMVKAFQEFDLKLPGLLIIDTPGHESFSNLRSRGSNLCDMAILVVDIMHGLEPQTIESINLLKKKHTPFVVALNKEKGTSQDVDVEIQIDRIFEWKKQANVQVEDTIKSQKRLTSQEFTQRTNMVITQLAEQGLNAALHYNNPDEKSYISLVPTSAHSGDGMGDLMAIICRLTQTRLAKKLAYSEELESTVMEVKALPGLGTTIDVILVNGKLKEGDTIVTGGFDGAIVTQIRSVLTPQPMRELRVKAQYIHHQVLKAAQGAKLCGKDLDKVLAGSPVFVAQHPDEVEVLKEEIEDFVSSSLKAIKVAERGVYVQASTLGSLEALLEFLKTSKIPYCGVNIGPVHKKDIMKCSVMLEHEPMYAVVLAFDVKVERDAHEYADKEGIKIFTAEIIYHLFDQFTAYCEDYKQKKRDEFKHLAVYPTRLRIMPEHIFNTRDPIVVGVNIEAGTLKIGTPMVVPSQNRVMIGFVTGIEANHKQLEKAASGQEVCVKIEPVPGEAPKLYGRHFTHEDILVSRISRESIDVMKQYFREDMTKADWQLIIELKKLLEIV